MRRLVPFLALWGLLGAASSRADTTPPVDIPGLREAKAHDRAIAAVDVQLQKGQWEAARAAASELLERSKGTWHGSLQRALVRLAIAESRLGRADEALWHWQAFAALGGGSLAGPLVERLGPLNEALAGNLGCTGARGPLWARFQAVIDPQGRMTQPAIVGSSVCYSYEVLKAARGWTFEPARRNGVAVSGMVAEAIDPPARKPFQELAADGPGLAEALALLQAGRYPAADATLERLWSTALDSGKAKRSYLASLLALKAIALAARPDPESQRRAPCLWGAAQGELTSLYHLDLTPFGAAGQRLEPHRFGEVRLRSGGGGAGPIERPAVLPETRRSPRARFPAGSYSADRVYIESMIDEQGSVREPLLFDLGEGMRGLDLEALEALCAWRFRPAQAAGKPVAILYVLTMSVGTGGAGARPPV